MTSKPKTRNLFNLSSGEDFVLFALACSSGLTSYSIGRRWRTSADDRWASPKVKVLRDLGLVRTDKARRPWKHRLTEAGWAEVARRKEASNG